MQKDKISIIVPIYKVEQYLERCITSITAQTYKDVEIILVDDGSPDNCGKICDTYAKADKRIKVIHKSNGGLSDARNVGIDNSTGEYIIFIDSDDWIDIDMVQVLYNVIKKYDADIAECSYRNHYPEFIKEETSCNGEVIIADPIFALECMLDWKYYKTNAWNKLYKRSVIGDIRYPKGRIHEDEFTTYKYFYRAKKLVYVDVSKYNYDRSRVDSITGEKFREDNLDACWAFRERLDFFEKNNLKMLEKKMCDNYCWLVLDLAYKCYLNKITGPKVQLLIAQVKKDIDYFKDHYINSYYYNEFKILATGLNHYGSRRNRRETQEMNY